MFTLEVHFQLVEMGLNLNVKLKVHNKAVKVILVEHSKIALLIVVLLSNII